MLLLLLCGFLVATTLGEVVDQLLTETTLADLQSDLRVPHTFNNHQWVSPDKLRCAASSIDQSFWISYPITFPTKHWWWVCENAFRENFAEGEKGELLAWASEGTGRGEWIQANFTTPVIVKEILFLQRRWNDGIGKGVTEVELHFDGNVKATGKLTELGSSKWNVVTLARGVATSFVRVTIKEVAGGQNNGFRQIAIFGDIPSLQQATETSLATIPSDLRVPRNFNNHEWVAFDKLKCSASSIYNSRWVCENAFRENFAEPNGEVAWASRGTGRGEWIQANFKTPVIVKEVLFLQRSRDRGVSVTEVELLFDGNVKATGKLTELGSSRWNVITLAKEVTTSTVRVTIKEVVGGQDNGFRQIAFFGDTPETAPPLPKALCASPTPTCSSSNRFYSVDGTCNNLDNPLWGSTNQPFQRLIPAEYGADFSPRGSPNSLPNPRFLSTTLHSSLDVPDLGLTNLVVSFGQFVDHDITLTPETKVECCISDGQKMPDNCAPIQIPSNDPFYSTLSPPHTCLNFGRSLSICSKPREQYNEISAFIDGSNIYGSDEVTAHKLRGPKVDGKLKTDSNNLLPKFGGNVTAGDIRVKVQPGLTSMHTLWMREHNRIAERTKQKNPFFGDEFIYLTTRQLVVAELQNIIYSEWLPIIIGSDLVEQNDLKVDIQEPRYDKTVNPTMINSFATAAFRFGHTLVQGTVNLVSSDGRPAGSFKLRNNFNNDTLYFQNGEKGFENIVKGNTEQPCQRFDRFVPDDLTNFLFAEKHDLKFGTDLMSLNIQRGRDHGLPGYNKFRVFCHLKPISNMATRPAEISSDKWSRLASVYENPDDIDLWTGSLLETNIRDGVVGPTFGCILAEQFKRLKFGDRFFFSHSGQAGSLSSEDFKYVRSRTMRDILCDNTSIKDLKENVFRRNGSKLKSCATA